VCDYSIPFFTKCWTEEVCRHQDLGYFF
jgi:hypothetical protein